MFPTIDRTGAPAVGGRELRVESDAFRRSATAIGQSIVIDSVVHGDWSDAAGIFGTDPQQSPSLYLPSERI